MSRAYYNDNDPYAAAFLKQLIEAGLIAYGDVDNRSIRDVTPGDLRGYTQCHIFAGLGGWSYALRLAGWSDDRPCWTGSCPCQPFSVAGMRRAGKPPAFLKLPGGGIRYRVSDVVATELGALQGPLDLDAVLLAISACTAISLEDRAQVIAHVKGALRRSK